jgi:hypothetical protein
MRTNPEEQFPRNSSPPPEIPPLPEMVGAMPPPLPKPQVVTTSGKKTVLMALGAMVVLLIGAVVAGVGLFWVTKRDLEVTPEHRAALHTAADLAEWYEFEVDPANSEITVLRRHIPLVAVPNACAECVCGMSGQIGHMWRF